MKKDGVKYCRRQKGLSVSENQQKKQKTRLHKLTMEVFQAQTVPNIVKDDESYFIFSGAEIPTNKGLYPGSGDAVPYTVRIAPTGKF